MDDIPFNLRRYRKVLAISWILILGLFILGMYWRDIWTPITITIGSYLLIDFLVREFLVVKERQGFYMLLRERKRKIEPITLYILFVGLIVGTTVIADRAIRLIEGLNANLPLWESDLMWSLAIGFFLLVNVLSLYRQS